MISRDLFVSVAEETPKYNTLVMGYYNISAMCCAEVKK